MKLRSLSVALIVTVLVTGGSLLAAQAPAAAPKITGAEAASQIIDKVIEREKALAERMNNYHPLVETYIQNLDKDNELAFVPVDYRANAPKDEWSGDRGCAVQYFSQQAVGRLLPLAGIDAPAGMSLPEKLDRKSVV